ncbi:MAG: metallophosphoesterase, partial [Betaproteobacteria bacterium]|nr:metallophosphoesterase [Betaproteobacteria bacterium]
MKPLRLVVRLAVIGLAVWSFGFEPGWLQRRDLTLAAPAWSGPALSIAVAADLHVGSPHAGLPMLRRVVDQLNASQPDLILLPGDFVIRGVPGGDTIEPAIIASELARLKAPLGVYATLG